MAKTQSPVCKTTWHMEVLNPRVEKGQTVLASMTVFCGLQGRQRQATRGRQGLACECHELHSFSPAATLTNSCKFFQAHVC